MTQWAVLDTPIGALSYLADGTSLLGVRFGAVDGAVPAVGPVGAELRAYFAGKLTDFSAAVTVRKGSDFERAVWAELQRIPYGETRSYGAIATAVGEPGGAQAVGTACNRNPIPVVVPCHRVIGADGKLVGFGGGLDRKRILLELEARVKMERDWA